MSVALSAGADEVLGRISASSFQVVDAIRGQGDAVAEALRVHSEGAVARLADANGSVATKFGARAQALIERVDDTQGRLAEIVRRAERPWSRSSTASRGGSMRS